MTALLAFWATALLLIAVPGADWAFTLDAGLRGHVVPAVAGLATGYLALTALVAGGVGGLVASSPAALTALTLVGGAYLVVHGCLTMRRPAPAPGAHADELPADPGRWTVARGVAVSGLNPKGLVLLVAVLPQFTSPRAAWPVTVQLANLGLVFVVTVGVFYLVLGTAAGWILRARPTLGRTVGRVAGAGMATVGIGLVVERLVT